MFFQAAGQVSLAMFLQAAVLSFRRLHYSSYYGGIISRYLSGMMLSGINPAAVNKRPKKRLL